MPQSKMLEITAMDGNKTLYNVDADKFSPDWTSPVIMFETLDGKMVFWEQQNISNIIIS